MTHKYLVNNDYLKIMSWNDYKAAHTIWNEITGPRGGKIRIYGNDRSDIPKIPTHVPEHLRAIWEYSIRIFPHGMDLTVVLYIRRRYGSSITFGAFNKSIKILIN